jgi:putative FmdB family regulatory protein
VPLYDFRCRSCGEEFEEFVPASTRPPCPACGAPEAERLLTSFAGPFTVGLRGLAAKRSNATRRVREEQRAERREQRREQRRQQGG